jgi:hypothetical protein
MGVEEGCLRNRFEMGKIMAFLFWQRPAGRARFLGSGRNAEKDRSSGNRRNTVIAGQAKWKSWLTLLIKMGDDPRRFGAGP